MCANDYSPIPPFGFQPEFWQSMSHRLERISQVRASIGCWSVLAEKASRNGWGYEHALTHHASDLHTLVKAADAPFLLWALALAASGVHFLTRNSSAHCPSKIRSTSVAHRHLLLLLWCAGSPCGTGCSDPQNLTHVYDWPRGRIPCYGPSRLSLRSSQAALLPLHQLATFTSQTYLAFL